MNDGQDCPSHVQMASLLARIPDCDNSRESLRYSDQRRPIRYSCIMSRVLRVYLTAAILACPLLCRFTESSAAAGGSQGVGCSCCQGSGRQSSEDGAPERRSSNPGGSCQCICGGAVVDDAAVAVAELDTSWWSPVAIIRLHSLSSVSIELDRFGAAPWPDIGMNPGRALCCLYSMLLC
jgi:hypothetical protein